MQESEKTIPLQVRPRGFQRLEWLDEMVQINGGMYGPRWYNMTDRAVMIECAKAVIEALEKIDMHKAGQ